MSGPVGSGKTTLVRTLSETEVVETEAPATEAIGKPTTTVAMDFGTLHLGGYTLYLFGTPGQERFDFVWEILLEGALGIFFLVRGHQPGDLAHARRQLDRLLAFGPVPYVIGVTHQDLPQVWTPEEVALLLGEPEERVVGLVATDRQSAAQALLRLLELILKEGEAR